MDTPQARQFEIRGVSLLAYDEAESLTLDRVINELACDSYGLEDIRFVPGDVAIDVGAHAGLVSMYLAKRWPSLLIHAFEPHPRNHANCARNLQVNGVSNVRLHRKGVNRDGRPMVLRWNGSNTGGATAAFELPGATPTEPVEATTLDRILDEVLAPGQRCRLLKMDCEGMEYEILETAAGLHRIDHLAAEFHEVDGAPFDPHALTRHCARVFTDERMRITYCFKRD